MPRKEPGLGLLGLGLGLNPTTSTLSYMPERRRRPRLMSLWQTEKRSKRPGRRAEKEGGRGGRVHIFITDRGKEEEEERGEGYDRPRRPFSPLRNEGGSCRLPRDMSLSGRRLLTVQMPQVPPELRPTSVCSAFKKGVTTEEIPHL